MNKAFIFDMDGVIVNSEVTWNKYESDFLKNALGKEIYSNIGELVGTSVKTIYERAKRLGFSMPYEEFQKIYDDTAFRVYDRAAISPDVEKLAAFLISYEFKIGIVSSSPISWINKVLPRLIFKDAITEIISLNSRYDLKHKPHPDGYVEMMKILKTTPEHTIILEDSNSGITAAKGSRAFTIAYAQNLVSGYKQISADAKADTMNEVIEIVKKRFKI